MQKLSMSVSLKQTIICSNRWLISAYCLCQIILAPISVAQTNSEADNTFAYIKSTLDTFNGSGRLVNNPGIDGADLEPFIDVLSEFELAFRKEFSPNSAMCTFYLDPENARLTIEERAEIAFSMMSDLNDRRAAYNALANEFSTRIESEFGSIVLGNIEKLEDIAVSYLRLPSSNFDEAAQISFLDAACS